MGQKSSIKESFLYIFLDLEPDILYYIAVDVFCKTGADISLKIFTKDHFEKMKLLATPFIEDVLKEGKKIA